MTIFLSPSNAIHPQFKDCFGFLVSPRKFGVMSEIVNGAIWGMDNDALFGFDAHKFVKLLCIYRPYIATNKFVAAPDVPFHGKETLKQFPYWREVIKALGYPVALVTQDGMKIKNIPWSDIDALFIGGSDEHKRGPEAGALIAEGKERGLWVHVGRVNGSSTMIKKWWMADSWDGQTVAKEPGPQSINFGRTIREIRGRKSIQGKLF